MSIIENTNLAFLPFFHSPNLNWGLFLDFYEVFLKVESYPNKGWAFCLIEELEGEEALCLPPQTFLLLLNLKSITRSFIMLNIMM